MNSCPNRAFHAQVFDTCAWNAGIDSQLQFTLNSLRKTGWEPLMYLIHE